MADLIECLGLGNHLDSANIHWRGWDFEALYGDLRSDPSKVLLCDILEQEIRSYFANLELPDECTLYDRLVLSLRPKDLIASFDWDPFLFDACRRNRHLPLPRVVYLHGNVRIGYCAADRVKSLVGTKCNHCGTSLIESRLLYPTKTKNYSSDVFIQAEWNTLRSELKGAFALTLFGYSAPQSDADAIELMKGSWGSPQQRNLEQVEIIDIRPESELRDTWDPFIHSHHYDVRQHFGQSVIALHPRRSVEALWNSFIEARFVSLNPLPETPDLSGLQEWLASLIESEADCAEE